MSLSHFPTLSWYVKQIIFPLFKRKRATAPLFKKKENSGRTLSEIWPTMSIERSLFRPLQGKCLKWLWSSRRFTSNSIFGLCTFLEMLTKSFIFGHLSWKFPILIKKKQHFSLQLFKTPFLRNISLAFLTASSVTLNVALTDWHWPVYMCKCQ